MKSLFPLPAPKRIGITRARLKVLDRIEMGQPLPRNVAGQVLRRLIKDELVVVTLGRPAVYRLTPVGRMVRSRPRYAEKISKNNQTEWPKIGNRQNETGDKHEPDRTTAAAE